MPASALQAFVRKEIRHILRDRQTLTVLLLMPLVQVVLFGYALRTDVRSVRLAIVDPTPDYATTALRNRLAANDRFQLVTVSPTLRAVEPLLQGGTVDEAVVFDPEFATRLARGDRAQVMIIVDASDPNTGSTMQGYAMSVISQYTRAGAPPGAPPGATRAVQIVPRIRMRFNPTLESVNLFVPGLIALVLTIVSALMTAISLSREKERGTLEVLLVSPLRPWQIIIGKVIPYIGLGFANVVTALGAAWLVFHVPMRGNLLLLAAESLLYIITSLALGVLIAARTSSQRTAMLGALVGLMMPTMILSGMVVPLASMPDWLQPVSYIVPARWFIVIARGIMLKGVGLRELWKETAVLMGMSLPLLAVSIRSFHVRLD